MGFGRLVTLAGAVGLLLGLVMPWYGERASDQSGTDVETYTAFQQFAAVDIALLVLAVLIVVAAIATPALAEREAYLLTAERSEGELYAGLGVLVAAGVALTLVLVKVAGPVPDLDFVLRYGARFALACAGVTVLGALVWVYAAIDRVLGALRDAS